MFNYYLHVTIRLIFRNKVYTLINIFGLALGIICTTLIGFYIIDELSYDKFHTKKDRIFRVVENDTNQDGEVIELATTFMPLAPLLQAAYSEIAQTVRIYQDNPLISNQSSGVFQGNNFYFVDSTFFEVFDFRLVNGDLLSALDEPFSIVISEDMADKYFVNQQAIGQSLTFRNDEGEYDFKITGVAENTSGQSHFHFQFLASMSSIDIIAPHVNNWGYPPIYTYVMLEEGVDIPGFKNQLIEFSDLYLSEDIAGSTAFELQLLSDIHLYSNRQGELENGGGILFVYLFGIIAIFILFIACINFINLSTARSADRAREVGIRKVIGAQKRQLISQFLGESTILALAAFLVSMGLLELLFPYFNQLTGKNFSYAWMEQWWLPFFSLGIVLITGLLAGIYPAFYLTGFSPLKAVKGVSHSGRKTVGNRVRKGLVVFQFWISSILIISTLGIYLQLDYVQSANLGFENERLVVIPIREEEDQLKAELLKEVILRNPLVQIVTVSSGVPGEQGLYDFTIEIDNNEQGSLIIDTITTDHDFVETYGIQLTQGRNFSKEYSTDITESFIINESAANKLGWENPLGQEVTLTYYFKGPVRKTGKIIGIIKDFHYFSLHEEVKPILLHILEDTYYSDFISVKIEEYNVQDTLLKLEENWQEFNPNRPFEFFFLEESIGTSYEKERYFGKLTALFSAIAIFIGCLGLFGLTAFTADQRSREIGIRKILGARIRNIVLLLSTDILKLVAIAFILAIPIAYIFMEYWLSQFPYRITSYSHAIGLTGVSSLFIALITTSSIAFKAAISNPTEALGRDQ